MISMFFQCVCDVEFCAQNYTALFMAVRKSYLDDYLEIIEILLNAGADSDIRNNVGQRMLLALVVLTCC